MLAKQPDISEPNFLTQYQIIYNIKSTYQIDVPGTKIWNIGANTVQCRGEQLKFWLQGKNKSMCPRHFFNFLLNF